MSAWATPRRNGGGGSRGGFVGPVRRAPAPAPRSVIGVTAGRAIPGRATNIPYYDPSRIYDDIKVVKDLRQSGTERGETQTGDDGILGPGSIAPPSTGTPGAPGTPKAPGKNNLIPIALAVAAFILLGG